MIFCWLFGCSYSHMYMCCDSCGADHTRFSGSLLARTLVRIKRRLEYREYIHNFKPVMKYVLESGCQAAGKDDGLFEWYYSGFEKLVSESNKQFLEYHTRP